MGYVPHNPPANTQVLTADLLSAALHAALTHKDIAEINRVLDTAYTNHIDFKPDWTHLHRAIKTGDRPILKLILEEGAMMTAEQSQVSSLLLGEIWQKLKYVLSVHDVPVKFTSEINTKTYREISRGLMELELRFDEAGSADIVGAWKKSLTEKFSAAVMRLDPETAALLAQAPHDDQFRLDISEVIKNIAFETKDRAVCIKKCTTLIDNLEQNGIAIQPVLMFGAPLLEHPELAPTLRKRHLLSHESAKHMDLAIIGLSETLGHQAETPEQVESQNANIKIRINCIQSLHFGDLVNKKAVKAVADMIDTIKDPEKLYPFFKMLLQNGFFDTPINTWPTEVLSNIGRIFDQTSHQEVANRMFLLATAQELTGISPNEIITKQPLATLYTSIKAHLFTLDSIRTAAILARLAHECKDETPSALHADIVKAMVIAGANFWQTDPMDYLGRKKPGLAWTLIESGAVPIGYIKFIDLCKKAKLISKDNDDLKIDIDLTLQKGHAKFEYMAFALRILLNSALPEKYAPGKTTLSTPEEWMDAAILENKQNPNALSNLDLEEKKVEKPKERKKWWKP